MAVRMAASERDWWMQGRSRAPLLSSIQRLVLALEWKSNSYSIREWSFWVTDRFVAERDALASQLLGVGQQIALTDQQPYR